MEQLDLFGGGVKVSEKPSCPRTTMKNAFRTCYGYKAGSYCKNCKKFVEIHYHNKRYFKCLKLGITASSASDIRKHDIACNLYEEAKQ